MTTSEEKEKKKPLSLRPGKLSLKKTVETGQVRQSFSHGRSKAVTVEVKRSRTFEAGAGGRMTEVTEARRAAEAALGGITERPTPEVETRVRSLTAGERATRAQALEQSRHDDEERALAEAEAETRRQEEEVAATARADEEAARAAVETETKAPAEAPAIPEPAAVAEERPSRGKPDGGGDGLGGRVKRKGAIPPKPAAPRRDGDERRRHGKLTISQALEGRDGRQRSLASVRRQREKMRAVPAKQAHQPPQRVIRDVTIPETITVQELANRMAERGAEVVKH